MAKAPLIFSTVALRTIRADPAPRPTLMGEVLARGEAPRPFPLHDNVRISRQAPAL